MIWKIFDKENTWYVVELNADFSYVYFSFTKFSSKLILKLEVPLL